MRMGRTRALAVSLVPKLVLWERGRQIQGRMKVQNCARSPRMVLSDMDTHYIQQLNEHFDQIYINLSKIM